jgi:hypothetical protein
MKPHKFFASFRDRLNQIDHKDDDRKKEGKDKHEPTKSQICRILRLERIEQLKQKYGDIIIAEEWADDGITEFELDYDLQCRLAAPNRIGSDEEVTEEFNAYWEKKRKHYDYERRILDLPTEERGKLLGKVWKTEEAFQHKHQHIGYDQTEYNAIRTSIIDDYFDTYNQQPPVGWMDVKRYSEENAIQSNTRST